ncbi:helix-turn-helix transcriptional regulator [Bradyrhizobium sp. 131]|uniref:helix-turn-helix domain-containing protein n=1 Tax=Bradyrhizobium sp. 131 TaxID=2782609 RepID=UPI001FFECA3A|nr:helix-turn-helix transcriptional regulator [Bradyrhizobium sp. 131]UPK17603.1 helix-turn-helix transcriptional regulator [Bradyrhizobium sp. 131]
MPRGRSDPFVEWIRVIMQKRDWTATDLARRSGLAPSTLLRALNDPEHRFKFTKRTLQKIADGAEEPIPPSLGGTDNSFAMGSKASSLRMLGVRNLSALPAKAQSAVKVGRTEIVEAPPRLRHDETAFALRNPDESLGAWFKPRCLMFATKVRDPAGGDLIVLTGKDGRTRLRLLLGIDQSGLRLSRTMPPGEDELMEFDDVAEVAVIVEVAFD